MLEKGTLIIVEWEASRLTVRSILFTNPYKLKMSTEKITTVGWVYRENEKEISIIREHIKTADECSVLNISKENNIKIIVLQDAKDCPFKES